MAFGGKKNSERLITEGDQVDLSKAVYSPDLSFTALDEETSTFTVTTDRVHFHKPLEIIMTVLEANGFASNIENLLACLDSLGQGVRVRAPESANADAGPIPVKYYIPCLNFQLPSKNKVGVLLKKFYAEIEGYELELAKLRGVEPDENGKKEKSREQLKRDVERLQIENSRLQATVNQLTEQLTHSMRSHSHVAKALESNNIIPPQLRPVLVREISLENRTVTLKAGRSSYVMPMALLRDLPKITDPCLVNIKDDKVIDAYFYETAGRAFEEDLAEVLHVEDQTCKLRDSRRKTHIWTAKHEEEGRLFPQIKRGSKVIISSIDGAIIKVNLVVEQDLGIWTQLVQDKQTTFQLERDRDAATLPIFDGKE